MRRITSIHLISTVFKNYPRQSRDVLDLIFLIFLLVMVAGCISFINICMHVNDMRQIIPISFLKTAILCKCLWLISLVGITPVMYYNKSPTPHCVISFAKKKYFNEKIPMGLKLCFSKKSNIKGYTYALVGLSKPIKIKGYFCWKFVDHTITETCWLSLALSALTTLKCTINWLR